jgi:glycosyltransferase involved in cell wall biosynthesis
VNSENNSMSVLERESRSLQSNRPARVLTVLPDFPYPARTGLHLRMVSNLELVRRLGCFSALLYFSTEARDPLPVESTPLAHFCDIVRHGGRRFPHSDFSTASLIGHKVDFFVRGALGIPGKRYPFSTSYDSIGAAEIISTEARRVEAAFVVLPTILMHYTSTLRAQGFGVIIDAADVLTNVTASFLKDLKGRGGRLGLYANYLASRTQERIFLKECSELWATSAAEAEEFRRISPDVRVLVVPNSLDENVIRPEPTAVGPVVGFIGTYSYTPNLQAALFLAEQVFPQVLDQCPNAILRIAGANMPVEAAAKLRTLKNVEMLGQVADSGRFMNDCAVLALPVFIRGGVPLKVIEAMARGKAIVASHELIVGLAIADGADMLVRNTPGSFAAAIVSLLGNASLREQLGVQARATFVREFSISRAERILRRDSVLVGHVSARL